MRSAIIIFALTLAATMAFAVPAFAGDQYVDGTGFAVSGYDVVAYRSLDQVRRCRTSAGRGAFVQLE